MEIKTESMTLWEEKEAISHPSQAKPEGLAWQCLKGTQRWCVWESALSSEWWFHYYQPLNYIFKLVITQDMTLEWSSQHFTYVILYHILKIIEERVWIVPQFNSINSSGSFVTQLVSIVGSAPAQPCASLGTTHKPLRCLFQKS